MQTDILEPLKDPQLLSELDGLAKRHRQAAGPAMQLIHRVGGSAEGLLAKLPEGVRTGLDAATSRALHLAFDAAEQSRGRVNDRPDLVNRVVTTAMGAAGGFAGLPGAVLELPLTVTMLLRAIQGIAAEHGFDPASEAVKLECLRIFASAGPLEEDDGTDLGLVAARVTITGPSLHGLIAKVAPRLATVMGQKLAAQATPVLGAVAGAAVNYAFTSYYQEIARVHFGLKQLAQDSGIDEGFLREELVTRLRKP